MAHSLIKPYSLLLYVLAVIVFFFFGILLAGLVDAGKGQMLAGGAIVLGYGLIGALIGFCISLILAYKFKRKTIISFNVVFFVLIISFWTYFFLKYKTRQSEKLKSETEQVIKQKPATTATRDNETAMLNLQRKKVDYEQTKELGLGMFKPNINESIVLYFYEDPNFSKALNEHSPTDSITFKKLEFGGIDISTAPPWLAPDHLKLDYDILYFRALSITDEFIEVVVNNFNGQTKYINRFSGKILYWQEFLLSVNSIELLNPEMQFIYIKPIEHSETLKSSYSFLRPLKVTRDWMLVDLIDDDYNSIGKGWIKWVKNGKLLIKYYLLS